MQQTAQAETKLAGWSVDRSLAVFPASIVFVILLFTFLLSLFFIFILDKSTNLFLILIPIVLFLLVISALPELFKSLGAIKENSEITLTERGISKHYSEKKEQPKYIAWDLMNGYDMSYLKSTSFMGKLFPRPTKFFIKSKYETDSFWLDAFDEDVDILRAYLKEHNVPFGFLKN